MSTPKISAVVGFHKPNQVISIVMALQQTQEALSYRRLFASRPGDALKQRFLTHVAETGSPETFPEISTTQPPSTGTINVVTEFEALRAKRPQRDLAPCPICNPYGPQYLKGVLIWCEETAAIYAIGYECGDALWAEGRLDEAISAHRAQRFERQTDDRLLALLPQVGAIRAWIGEHSDLATTVERLGRSLSAKTPDLHRRLVVATKEGMTVTVRATKEAKEHGAQDGMEVLAHIDGPSFVNQRWTLVRTFRDLDEIYAKFDRGEDDMGYLQWCIDTGLPEKRKAILALRNAARDLRSARARICDALDFLSERNLKSLVRWGAHGGGPGRIIADSSAERVRIALGSDIWSATIVDLRQPAALPALADI